MGIQGLIPFLEKASRKVNIGQYAGCCVAVDAYCWLHKGAYSCVEKLARGESCDAYVHYCMKFVNMLLSYNIKPILVFDGQHLPAKAATEKKRRESRQSSRKQAAELLRAGRINEARNFLRRCIDITHEMALALIHECRRRNVDCIVAPYEADAQLAYLNLKNITQIVITEDSDLVLFGCTKILFKMDLAGNGLLVEQERLHLAMGTRPEKFSFDKFRYMCILSGCDYLPSLPGIGLSKACKFITRTVDADIHRALSRLPSHLNMKSLTVPEDYRDAFLLADAAFRYQLVFDPLSCRLVHLNEPEDSEKVTPYAGKMLPSDTAYQLALGNLNPFTLQQVDNFNPHVIQQPKNVKTNSWNAVPVAPHASIWSQSYKVLSVSLKQDPRQVDRPSTKGKVLKKDVSLVTQPTRQHDDILDTCTDADLTSMYMGASVGEPPAKRRRSDSCDLDEAETEKENSSETTPTEQDAHSTEQQTSVKCVTELTPVQQCSPKRMTSPVLSTGKNRRNPFFKQMHPHSPTKNQTISSSSPCATGLREQKFSALSKFGKLRRTDIDDETLVKSRYFSKQNNSEKKGMHEDTDKESECSTKTSMQTQDVSSILTANDITSLLDTKSCHETGSPSKRNRKSDTTKGRNSFKTMNVTAVLETLDMDEGNPTTNAPTKECESGCETSQSNIEKPCTVKSESPSGDSMKTASTGMKSLSKSFSWSCNRFGFQKCTSIGSLDRSAAVIKDFKNPFKKTDLSPKDKLMLQVTDRTSVMEGSTSASQPLTVEEEEVDDPSPVDSGLELSPLTSPQKNATSCAAINDSLTADDGFHSPGSSQLSHSRSLGCESKAAVCYRPGLSKSSSKQQSKAAVCYRPGLSKSSSKQQSLLSMFGFQKKVKLQHV